MVTKVSIDGVMHDEADARVSVFDRGFLYGDSVFEVMRTYGGVPFGERPHLERLARSAERVLIRLPVDLETLAAEIHATLDVAGNAESYVRVIVTRGTGPLTYDPTTAHHPTRVVVVSPLKPQPPEMYRDGVEVCLLRAARPTDEPRIAGVKTSNYLASVLAVHEAHQRGGYEAILLGPTGEVLEGASSNIFAVHEGRLRTPPLDAPILAGITRKTVVSLARDAGLVVEEAALFPRDLYDADEVFITSTLREVVPVTAVDGRPVAGGRPGPVTRRLHAAYRAAAGA